MSTIDTTITTSTTVNASSELEAQAIEALAVIDAGEVKFVHADVKKQTMRLLGSTRPERITQGLEKFERAQNYTFSQLVWQELVVAGVPFKVKTKIVEGLKSTNPETRTEAMTQLEELRSEIASQAEKASQMIAEIEEIVTDSNFMKTVVQPLHGKAMKAAELKPSDLVFVHKTLTNLEARFYGGAPATHAYKGKGSRSSATKRQSRKGTGTPASRGEVGWQEKQEAFPVGKPNPQGDGTDSRGVAVAHAGLGHKEKSNKGIKK